MMDLEKFFKEKEIPLTEWSIEHKGIMHFIDSDYVMNCILKTVGTERKKIEGTLFVIDQRNGNVLDYLKYLAQFFIQHQY